MRNMTAECTILLTMWTTNFETYMNKCQIYFYADDAILFSVTDSVWSAFKQQLFCDVITLDFY